MSIYSWMCQWKNFANRSTFNDLQRRPSVMNTGVQTPVPSLLFPIPLFSLPSPPLRSSAARGSGERCKPKNKLNLVHFSLKIWHLVATILTIFLRINSSNSGQFKQYILGPSWQVDMKVVLLPLWVAWRFLVWKANKLTRPEIHQFIAIMYNYKAIATVFYMVDQNMKKCSRDYWD